MIFIHTADIHLDASLEAGMPKEKASERRREIYLAFEQIADDAEKMGAKAVLIAGDLFDGANPSPLSVSRVSAIIASHPKVDFILLSGNHDHTASVSLPLQSNLKTFEKGMGVFRYDSVAVYGAEDCRISPDDLGMCKEDCNIVMLHGEVREGESGEIGLKKWQNTGVDYLALGHYHRYEENPLDGRGKYAYAGCPAGRGFDECGHKGYVRLTVDNGRVTTAFVPMEGRVFHTVKVDVSALSTTLEIQNAVTDACREIASVDAVKIELTGECAPSLLPDVKMLQTKLSTRFWFARIKDCTILKTDVRESDKSLTGAFVRLVTEKEADGDFRQRVLACGLRALKGEETAE